jgi:hypothetical protein
VLDWALSTSFDPECSLKESSELFLDPELLLGMVWRIWPAPGWEAPLVLLAIMA